MVTRKLEIHLEEWGERSWLTALLNTVSGSYGSAQLRFVARRPGDRHVTSDDVVVGATFPAMRFQDLDDLTEPNAWIDTARDRLRELDEHLTAVGWRREPGTGRHWWQLAYTDAAGPPVPPTAA
jgi:hypothetical protein